MKRILLSLMIVTAATPLMGMLELGPQDQDSQDCDLFRLTACYRSVALCNIKCEPENRVNCISLTLGYKDCVGCTTCGVSCHYNPTSGGDNNSTTVGLMK